MGFNLAEVIRFVITGGASFIVDFSIMLFLTEKLGFHYLFAASMGFSISVIFNYFLCSKWVFKSQNKRSIQGTTLFVGSSIIGLIINQILMWFLVEFVHIFYMVAKIITTMIVLIWNFIIKRKVLTSETYNRISGDD